MANEFVHGTVGTGMTQAEFEAVGLHVFNSQAIGDLLYASSTTQLTRLGIGSTNAVLTVIGGVPTWQTTLSGLTFIAPALGAATATSINSLTITTSAGTLTIANNASAALVTSGNYSITLTATAATNVTLPTTGTLATLAGTEELDSKTLDSSVGKGTWTASGTWTLPAFTLGGDITTNGKNFDAGAVDALITTTGEGKGLLITSTTGEAGGAALRLKHNSATPANNDTAGIIHFNANNSTPADTNYGFLRVQVSDQTATAEIGLLEIYLKSAGADNQALTLTGAGTLGVDLSGVSGTYANVNLFDEYDDALVIREGIQQRNRELLADIGVLARKNTGSGYMLKIQPMIRLLAGGIYQTRERIDEMASRLEMVEQRLLLRGGN